MVDYWICVTNEENWNVVKKRNVWGVPERDRRRIEEVRLGDYLVFYLMPRRVAGVFRAASEAFESREPIFSWGEFGRHEVFPYRVKLEPMIIPEEPLQFRELIPKLRFITNKKMWTGHLRRAMRIIPKEDYEVIVSSLKRT